VRAAAGRIGKKQRQKPRCKTGTWGTRDVKKYYAKFDVAVLGQMP
jgi:hypothetical protein